MTWVRTKIEIPKGIKKRDREIIGEAVVEYIRIRSLEGRDKNNRKFPKYTADYAKGKGVSRDSVDLFLSGDMLEELRVLSHKNGELLIGFDRDSEMNGRAEGNILGTYGQSEPIPGKKRDFLGITKKDLNGLLDARESEEITLTDDDIDAIARRAAEEMLGISFDTENN